MGFNNQVEPHAMALELSVAFDNSGAEGWQCDWLSCFDCSFTIRLCLHKLYLYVWHNTPLSRILTCSLVCVD